MNAAKLDSLTLTKAVQEIDSLLTALKRLTDLTDKATNWHGDMRRAIDEARAAIAKAEGRS